MNLLEDYIQELMNKPLEKLNKKYITDEVMKEELDILFLPLVDKYVREQKLVKESSHVSEAVLNQLHGKIRCACCEDSIWGGIFWYLITPLPLSLAHDLIDRRIAPNMMGLTRQLDEVQWRLATFDENSLYTLIRERYQQEEFSVSQFENMLEQYIRTHCEGVLYMLSFYETPSDEKKAALIAAIIREKRSWRAWKHIKKRLKEFLREQSQG